MKAIKRSKRIYEFLMLYGNEYLEQEVIDERKKGMELFFKNMLEDMEIAIKTDTDIVKVESYTKYMEVFLLENLKFVEIIKMDANDENSLFLWITQDGWKFCESFEKDDLDLRVKEKQFEQLTLQLTSPNVFISDMPGTNPLSFESIQNNFDNIPIQDVHSHFYNALVKTRYITEDELVLYLKSAFQNKQIPATLFSFKNTPTRQVIMKVFYEYYKIVAFKPHGKQTKYAALLGDYFNGYNTKTVSTNFNK